MANKPEQLRLTPDERADLVAYIDGELPETHSQAISTKLTHSATARREVEMLQKTWEMLDFLPRPQLPSSFRRRRFRTSDGSSWTAERGSRSWPHGRLGQALVAVYCVVGARVARARLFRHPLDLAGSDGATGS